MSVIQSAVEQNIPAVYTYADVAQILRMHPASVRKMCYAGEISTVIVGKRPRVLLTELERYLSECRPARTPPPRRDAPTD